MRSTMPPLSFEPRAPAATRAVEPTHLAGSEAFWGPLGTVLRATHEAIIMVNEAQTIVAFNPAAQALLACAPAQALGQRLEQFIPAVDRSAHAQHVRSFAQSHEMQRKMAPQRQVKALRADGREVPVEVTLSRVDTVVDGVVQHWYAALLRDISAEQALRNEVDVATRRLYAALDATPAAIWIVQDERIDYANRAATQLVGTPSAEVQIGWPLSSILQATTLQALRRALAGSGANAIDRVAGQLLRSDGQLRDIEIALAPLPDHGHAVVQMVIDDVTERRRAAAEVARAGQALRRLQASVVEAREEERRRISRELHDELGQRLTALKMDVTALAHNAGLRADDEHVQAMQTMLDDTVASVRRIASDLRPLMLDDLGLSAAIEWLAREMARRTGIDIRVRLDDAHAAPSNRIATVLYRTAQEALTNVVRHAEARHVEIGLQAHDQQWVLTVQDDGVGLRDASLLRDDAFGLMGIRERAAMLGGSLSIETVQPEGGTRLKMVLPVVASRDPS
jgi:two-component system, NarL family, sensor histidine kinase UhpB